MDQKKLGKNIGRQNSKSKSAPQNIQNDDQPAGHLGENVTENALVKNTGLGQMADSFNAANSSIAKAKSIMEDPNATSTDKAMAAANATAQTAMQSVALVQQAKNLVGNTLNKVSEAIVGPVMKVLAGPLKGIACLPIAKHLDPVLGIDVHFVMPEVPVPHPYIGMIFDPKDWVSVIAASIVPPPDNPGDDASVSESASFDLKSTGFQMYQIAVSMVGGATIKIGPVVPRAVAGTKTVNFPHIPIGPGWAPAHAITMKNHGYVFLGSLFVAADCEPLASGPLVNNDCWDVGMPALFRQMELGRYTPFYNYLPTGLIMPIPWNRPILVNPIPTPINPMTALTRLFQFGLGKLRKAARAKNEKIISNMNGSCASKTFLSKLFGTGQSHPVEVAEGYFYTDNEDFSLPGPLPLVWERTWYSYSPYEGPLGHGWHHSYDMAISIDTAQNNAMVRMADGRGVDIPLPVDCNKPSFHRLEKLWVHLHTEGYYFVEDAAGLQYKFTKAAYMPHKNGAPMQLLQSVSDKNNFSIQFLYTNKGHLSNIIDSVGRNLIVSVDDYGRITAIHAPHPVQKDKMFPIARYNYTQEGDMSWHADALSQLMTFEYEGHQMVKEVWRNGLTWQFRYNGLGTNAKCIEVWGDGNLLHYKFDYSDPQCTLVTDSLGHQKQFYHHKGRVVKHIDANGATWQYYYNQFSELEWQIDALGNQTGYTHDEFGNVLTITEPDGCFTQMGYFNSRFPTLPTEAIDPNGGKWEWSYDSFGNISFKKNPKGAITQFEYDKGLLQCIQDAYGAKTHIYYDTHLNIKTIQAPNGAQTHYGYNILGQTTLVTNPNGVMQTRVLDLLGRAISINDFDDNIIQLRYDAMDNVVRYSDQHKTVDYAYKGLWKLTSRSEAGATIKFVYDTEDQLRRIVNEEGSVYQFELDAVGNVVQETGFDGIMRQYERNPAGWVTKVKRPASRFTAYNYDEVGRITEVSYHDGSTETYSYNKGLLQTATNSDAQVTFERDIMGNVLVEKTGGHAITNTYDILSRRVGIQSDLGADIAIELNAIDNITKIEANGWQAQIDYDILGLETGRSLTGGVQSQWQRDRLGRVKTHRVSVGGTQNPARLYKQYVWEANDQLRQIKDAQKGTTTFEHDQWGNLSKTIFGDGAVQLRNPDKVGNLFETKDRRDRKYNKGGKLIESKTAHYHYDEEGFLTEKIQKNGATWHYKWNAAGMLSQVTRPDKNIVIFAYDALGRRVEKRYKSTITKWLWDGNKPLHEWKEFDFRESTADELITWIFEEDSFAPAAKIKGDKKYSLVTDHIGTPIQGYNEKGDKIWERELDSYGKQKQESGDDGFCGFKYQGQTYDKDIDLTYNRFRWYSPDEGMYISQDPLGLAGGTKLYAYVNDPNTWTDVFGLKGDYHGMPNIPGYQKHHIIPQSMNHPMLSQIGYDVHQSKNIVYLPKSSSIDPTRTVHNGPHNQAYNDIITGKLNKIDAMNASDAVKKMHVDKVMDDMRDDLLNKRQPLNSCH